MADAIWFEKFSKIKFNPFCPFLQNAAFNAYYEKKISILEEG